MLAPDERALLLDALRPPAGGRLARAIGTTFSLDLATALTVPLAFAGYALSASPDPIAVMEALRASADVLDVFFQAGAVGAARWPSDLVALLEPVLHEVRRPRPGHLFHPKTWVAHYVVQDPAGDATDAFRVLVLSRNLTADRSWDVIVRLDGIPSRTINRANDGLVRFVNALADLPKERLTDDRREAIRGLADTLRRIDWELPPGAQSAHFWPMGLPGMRSPRLDELFTGYRHLVVSPFVTPGGLDAIIRPASGRRDATVVSRPEELGRLDASALERFSAFVMSPLAGLDTDSAPTDPTATATPNVFGALHAKAIVVESNRRARLFLGSANATDAAFGGNVEMLVELAGSPGQLGVDTMLGVDAPFRALLDEYQPPTEPVIDEIAEMGRTLESLLVDSAQLAYAIELSHSPEGWRGVVTTTEPLPPAPAGVAMTIRPFNRPQEQTAIGGNQSIRVELGARPAAEVTPFLVLSACVTLQGQEVARSTVVKAELVGGPEDRLGEILVRQIDSPEKFLRLLFLLLGLGQSIPAAFLDRNGDRSGGSWNAASPGVFEMLVRALATDPAAIDRLDDIVRRLRDREDGHCILPEGWDRVWAAVTAARKLIAIDS